MSKLLFSAVVGAAALIGFPGMSSAAPSGGHSSGGHSSGGHSSGGHSSGGHSSGGFSHSGGYSHGGYGNGGYNRGYYGGGYGGLGLYLGGYGGYGYGYGSPYYGSSYYYAPPADYNYIQPTYGSYQGTVSPAYYDPQDSPSDVDSTTAQLEVRVPANAELWFEGERTAQTGAVRHFVSPALASGKNFTYDIRARWTDANGKAVDLTKRVTIRAGARIGVDFNNP